jgi:hypothetical protein
MKGGSLGRCWCGGELESSREFCLTLWGLVEEAKGSFQNLNSDFCSILKTETKVDPSRSISDSDDL